MNDNIMVQIDTKTGASIIVVTEHEQSDVDYLARRNETIDTLSEIIEYIKGVN